MVALAGHLLGVPLFTKLLHFSDCIILLITITDKIVTNIFFGLAKSPGVFYVGKSVVAIKLYYTCNYTTHISGVAISLLTRSYRTAKKSIATKIVSKNDIGKAQSLLGICDVLAPAALVPIYNKVIYLSTLRTFPPAFFFFSILLYTGCCLFVL